MLLTRLRIHNFGPLGGDHSAELRPLEPSRPIILFGGKNGAGKTSLLEGVRLCLYGRRALGPRPSEREYQEYLAEKLHRGTTRAWVGLEFELGQAGERTVYHVQRGWTRSRRHVSEELVVFRDGAPLSGLDRAHWQDFVDNLIPPALAGLFFFDGERIQALAEDTNDGEFTDAVRALLGLDLVRQLQADLSVYLARQASREDTVLAERIATLDRERAERAAQREVLGQEVERITGRITQLKGDARNREDRLVREGGAFAQRRGELEAQRGSLEERHRDAEDRLRALCGGLLPFALVPDLTGRVVAALSREEELRTQAAVEAAGSRLLDRLRAVLRSDGTWEAVRKSAGASASAATALLGATERNALADHLLAVLRQTLSSEPGPAAPEESPTPPIHGLSAVDASWVAGQLRRALVEVAPSARRLGEELAETEAQLRRIQEHLHRAPSDETLRPLVARLSAVNADLSAASHELDGVRAQLELLKQADDAADREMERLQEEFARGEEADRRVRLADRVQGVLRDFYGALNRARLTELERSVTHCVRRLARKGDLIGRVEIDPETLRVVLRDGADKPISKASLSAGEKQIYAIALLWGLAQVSGRRLPVIIDTPLGRLDSDHRANLARAYFPHAAEQVILLSTDTEVDEAYVGRLMPALSRTYRIDYDEATRSSSIVRGYFWSAADDPMAAETLEDLPPLALLADDAEDVFMDRDDDDGTDAAHAEQLSGARPPAALEPAPAGT